MQAFSEDLSHYRYVDLIRVGEVAERRGSDWEYVVTCCGHDRDMALLLGLSSAGGFSTAHKVAIFSEVRRLGYQAVKWQRKLRDRPGFRTVTARL